MTADKGVNRLLVNCGNGSADPRSIELDQSATLKVEIRRGFGFQPADAAAVDAIVAGRSDVGVFVSSAWLSGLFAEPPDGCEPALLVLRESSTPAGVRPPPPDPGPRRASPAAVGSLAKRWEQTEGTVRAIVPIAVRDALTHVHVGLLGGGLGSDRIDLVAARGFEARAADAFLTWLGEAFGRRAFILELRDVPADSSIWGAVHRAGLEHRLSLALQPREVHTLPYLDLASSGSSTAGLASRARNARSMEKHLRWLERRGRVTIETLDDPGDVWRAFTQLREFLHRRWNGQPGGSVLDNPRASRFHQDAIHLLLKDGHLRMIRLLVDTRPVAMFYGLASGSWRGYYLAGYDREWAGRIHLGQIMLAAAIDVAAQEGASEFDFLKGAERVKYLWPVRERSTLDADVYSARSGAQLKRATRASRDAVVAFAKSVRELITRPTYGSHSSLR
jgi:CelD/BcsL family acetyltransferase involved in cellulose biosynthesis